jgi:hypothetical protein
VRRRLASLKHRYLRECLSIGENVTLNAEVRQQQAT